MLVQITCVAIILVGSAIAFMATHALKYSKDPKERLRQVETRDKALDYLIKIEQGKNAPYYKTTRIDLTNNNNNNMDMVYSLLTHKRKMAVIRQIESSRKRLSNR